MFDEYELEVLREYQEKKDTGAFLTNLAYPAPAKLKNECIATFDRRYHKKDDIALRSFFDPRDGTEEAFRLSISKCDTDKFRPLNTILTKGRRKTDRKNIELLAWLIDFQPRPYATWLNEKGRKVTDTVPPTNYDKPEGIPPVINTDEGHIISPEVEPPVSLEENKISNPQKKVVMILLLLLVLSIGAYLIWSKKSSPANKTETTDPAMHHVTGPIKHMYWDNDHYDTINASSSAPAVPLDTFRLAHFRQVDTSKITAQSIGHTWYFNTGHGLACYTGGGPYPLDTNRRLKPMTLYMVNKYFHH